MAADSTATAPDVTASFRRLSERSFLCKHPQPQPLQNVKKGISRDAVLGYCSGGQVVRYQNRQLGSQRSACR